MKVLAFFILVVVAFVISSCSNSPTSEYKIQRLSDGAAISFSKMIGELEGVGFVFVGEKHNSMENHQVQLKIIEELHRRGRHLTVGLEMFWAKSQPELDRWSAGEMNDDDFIRLYYRNWRMPWPLYRNIFFYLKEQGIPMVGLNIPNTISKKVAAHGADSLSEEDLAELPPGLSCDVRPGYKDFIRQVFTEHAGEGKSFQNFCEAQVLWDKVMAWHLLQQESKNPGMTVVLCGFVHALKRGIPSRVEEMQKGSTVKVIVPWAQGMDPRSITSKLADYLIIPSDRTFPAGSE